jgi:probable HAF family extracellular repeat protein
MAFAQRIQLPFPRRYAQRHPTERLAIEPLEGRLLPSYAVADLGTLGGPASFAYGLNNAGQVVGYSYLDDGPDTHAFLWQAGTMTDLGTSGSGRGSSRAFAVSDTGRVAGQASVRGGAAERAVVWDSGVPTDLGTLGGQDSFAYAVNRGGTVVGASALPGDTPVNHAFAAHAGALRDLGTLGGLFSAAYGVNDAGVVVGASAVFGGVTHAFRSAAGGLADLGTLPGYVSSAASAVNDAGQVVGTATAADGSQRAFLDAGDTMTELGLPPRAVASGAQAVNRFGEVVGFLGVPGPGGLSFHAFVYANGRPADLNDLLPAGTGWVLNFATAVNDRGQIAGWGVNPQGKVHAFLLTPGREQGPDVVRSLAATDSPFPVPDSRVPAEHPATGVGRPQPPPQVLSGWKGKAGLEAFPARSRTAGGRMPRRVGTPRATFPEQEAFGHIASAGAEALGYPASWAPDAQPPNGGAAV